MFTTTIQRGTNGQTLCQDVCSESLLDTASDPTVPSGYAPRRGNSTPVRFESYHSTGSSNSTGRLQ